MYPIGFFTGLIVKIYYKYKSLFFFIDETNLIIHYYEKDRIMKFIRD